MASPILGQYYLQEATADQAIASSTVLANTALILPVAANQKVAGTIFAPFTLGGTASGAKFELIVPAAGVVYQLGYELIDGNGKSVAQADLLTAAASFSNALAHAANYALVAWFRITNGATAGNITLQMAQLVSDAAEITLLKGAWIDGTRF